MPKLRMPIARLTEDEMREIVLDRIACKVMFSGEIPAATRRLCLLPVAMGALTPPSELVEALFGSTGPPDALEGEPPKPLCPGYPEGPGGPPVKPVLSKVDAQLLSDVEWGDAEPMDLEQAEAAIVVSNGLKVQLWEDATMAWHKSLDDDTKARRAIDVEHEAAVDAWEASLDSHTEVVVAREAVRQDWITRYDAMFSEWCADVGEIMGRMKDAFPRGVNGYPMFHAVTIIHCEDWPRIEAAIIREQSRSVQV
jgi:hypothetical protein